MKIEDLRFDDTAIRLIMNLALKVELSSGLRYRAAKKIEDLIGLISLSQQTPNEEVKQALTEFVSYLNPLQKDFFSKSGINTSLFQGNATTAQEKNAPIESTEEQAGKRKIVYRGQVKWV